MKLLAVILLLVAGLTGCHTTTKSTATGSNPGKGGIPSGVAGKPYAKPVPGKEGFVYSPFTQDMVYIDVRGFSRGTEVQDPFAGGTFLVP